jgi:hypothetical protein
MTFSRQPADNPGLFPNFDVGFAFEGRDPVDTVIQSETNGSVAGSVFGPKEPCYA